MYMYEDIAFLTPPGQVTRREISLLSSTCVVYTFFFVLVRARAAVAVYRSRVVLKGRQRRGGRGGT